jgi:hypothetical protein
MNRSDEYAAVATPLPIEIEKGKEGLIVDGERSSRYKGKGRVVGDEGGYSRGGLGAPSWVGRPATHIEFVARYVWQNGGFCCSMSCDIGKNPFFASFMLNLFNTLSM